MCTCMGFSVENMESTRLDVDRRSSSIFLGFSDGLRQMSDPLTQESDGEHTSFPAYLALCPTRSAPCFSPFTFALVCSPVAPETWACYQNGYRRGLLTYGFLCLFCCFFTCVYRAGQAFSDFLVGLLKRVNH